MVNKFSLALFRKIPLDRKILRSKIRSAKFTGHELQLNHRQHPRVMTKKDIFFLLTPSVLFAAMASVLLFYATEMFPDPQNEQWIRQASDELVQKIQSRKLNPKSEKLAKMLRDSIRSSLELQEALARTHAVRSRT